MEAEFKSTQRFVTPLVGILPKVFFLKMTFGLKSVILNHFNAHFQQYSCLFTSLSAFPLTYGQIKVFQKMCYIAIKLPRKWIKLDANESVFLFSIKMRKN